MAGRIKKSSTLPNMPQEWGSSGKGAYYWEVEYFGRRVWYHSEGHATEKDFTSLLPHMKQIKKAIEKGK